jgi:hypothetical protein
MLKRGLCFFYIGKAKNLKNRVSSYFRKGAASSKQQVMVAGEPSRSIGNICLNLKHQLATGGNQITGCSILTGGKMAFIVFSSIHATSIPYDICRGNLRSVDPSAFSISRYTE